MRTLQTAAGALLAAALLTACSSDGGDGGSGGDYCDELKSAQSQFSALEGGGGAEDLSKAFDTFRDLEKSAPDEVQDDWKTLVGAVDTIEKAYEDAGIDVDDASSIDPTKLDQAQIEKLTSAMSSLSGEEYTQAGDAISKHAKSECDVDLEAS